MNTRIASLLGLAAASLACSGLLEYNGTPRYDNALTLEMLLPATTVAAQDIPLSRFLVPHTGVDAEGHPVDDLSAEALADCAGGADLHDLHMDYAAVEITPSAVRVSGTEVVALDGGRLPEVHGDVVEPVLEALHERMVAAKRWEARGCAPWGERGRLLLVAAHPTVPSGTVQVVLRSATLAGFPLHALAVAGPVNHPGSLPEVPDAPSARRLSVIVGPDGVGITGVDVQAVALPGDHDWAALRESLEDYPSDDPEILVAVDPALPYGVLAGAVGAASASHPVTGVAVSPRAELPPAPAADAVVQRELTPEGVVTAVWVVPARYDVVPMVQPASAASGALLQLLGSLSGAEEEAGLEIVEIDAVVRVAEAEVDDEVAEGPSADDLFGSEEDVAVLDIAAPAEEAAVDAPEVEPPTGVVLIESPRVYGALDKATVGEVVRRGQSELLSCYGQGLSRHARLSGTVKVHYVIGSGGAVKSADLAFTTLRDGGVEACVVGAFQGMSFPEPGSDVEVFHKLVFSP